MGGQDASSRAPSPARAGSTQPVQTLAMSPRLDDVRTRIAVQLERPTRTDVYPVDGLELVDLWSAPPSLLKLVLSFALTQQQDSHQLHLLRRGIQVLLHPARRYTAVSEASRKPGDQGKERKGERGELGRSCPCVRGEGQTDLVICEDGLYRPIVRLVHI